MEELLSATTFMFAACVIVICYVIRKIAEFLAPTLSRSTALSKAQMVWEKLLLPLLPIGVGIMLALVAKTYPYPTGISSSASRVVFGAVCGFFSTWVYTIGKAVIQQKYSVDLKDIGGDR